VPKKFKVQKLFVGVSFTASVVAKLLTLQSFPLGLLSIPSADVLELSEKSK